MAEQTTEEASSLMDKETVIGLADIYGTRAEVSVLDDDDGDPTIHFALTCGASGVRTMPTPTACRQLAAALLDAADRVLEGGAAR